MIVFKIVRWCLFGKIMEAKKGCMVANLTAMEDAGFYVGTCHTSNLWSYFFSNGYVEVVIFAMKKYTQNYVNAST